MSIEGVRLFKTRALNAYERATDALEAGDYDWAIFLLEQAFQLLIRYILALKLGYFPRAYSISRLLEEAEEVSNEFSDFLARYRSQIAVLEDAYIASRYYPRRYREEDVRDKLEIFKELLELVERHEE